MIPYSGLQGATTVNKRHSAGKEEQRSTKIYVRPSYFGPSVCIKITRFAWKLIVEFALPTSQVLLNQNNIWDFNFCLGRPYNYANFSDSFLFLIPLLV